MDVALENVRKRAAEGATQKTFCEISQAKGQSEISGAFLKHRYFV